MLGVAQRTRAGRHRYYPHPDPGGGQVNTKTVSASARILRRIKDVDRQIERSKNDQAELEQLGKVRRAYLIDLMDTLNEEQRLCKRRKDDPKISYDLPATERWVTENS